MGAEDVDGGAAGGAEWGAAGSQTKGEGVMVVIVVQEGEHTKRKVVAPPRIAIIVTGCAGCAARLYSQHQLHVCTT